MKKLALVALCVTTLSGCAVGKEIDKRNEKRGRGDAPVGLVDDTKKDVIQFPDRFSNVAHACDGHGHRVFVTTKSDQSRFMVVIADDSCNGKAE